MIAVGCGRWWAASESELLYGGIGGFVGPRFLHRDSYLLENSPNDIRGSDSIGRRRLSNVAETLKINIRD